MVCWNFQDGSTPLMEAILSGNATTEDKLDIIEQLINLGASPHCETKVKQKMENNLN